MRSCPAPRPSIVPALLAGTVAVFASACSCGEPSLPPPPPPPDSSTGDTSVEETGDTAPPPPCDAPEVEPNDSFQQATLLPVDQIGCGEFASEGDVDNWEFVVDEPTWVTVRAYADAGSAANVALFMSSSSGEVAAGRDGDFEAQDVTLLFPAQPDRYTINVREETSQGGDRYGYELVSTIAKSPVFFDDDGNIIDWVEELEPNDDELMALPLRDGDAILGFSDVPTDPDWYVVTVPPGRHTLTFDIQAYLAGSSGDYRLTLVDEDLEVITTNSNQGPVTIKDPRLVYGSDGDETLYLLVLEEDGVGNPAVWYLLDTRVEADQ